MSAQRSSGGFPTLLMSPGSRAAALESFKAQVTRLRTIPSPGVPTLTRLHDLAEGIVGQPLPLMTITWPESADPFAGPTLA